MSALRSALARRFIASVNAGIFSRVNTGIESPVQFPNLAAWYDLSDVSSLRNNAGAIPASGDGIKLVGDKSGNSSVNVLCLNGVAGNYASLVDSAAISFAGDHSFVWRLSMNDWTPGSVQAPGAQWGAAGNRAWGLEVSTGGILQYFWSADGTAVLTANSTAAISTVATDLAPIYIRVDHDVDNGAAGNTVRFYYSSDGVSWTQLGADVVGVGTTSYFNSTANLEIGSRTGGTNSPLAGVIYQFILYDGLLSGSPTIAANVIFATAAKLATSFTESSANAATVTINTSGDTGARICGARDLYQGTAANQPILTIAGTGNLLTFDGSNDYMKAAPFALAQPENVYFAGSQVTWTAGDSIYDGGGSNTLNLQQFGSTPEVIVYASGANTSLKTSPTLATKYVMTGVFNGTSSQNRLNRQTAALAGGQVGTAAGNGFTLACNANGVTGPANITASEIIIYAAAHDQGVQDRVILYLGRKWGIAV